MAEHPPHWQSRCDDPMCLGVAIMTGNVPIDIQRCDQCARFPTDEDAALYLESVLREVAKLATLTLTSTSTEATKG